MLPGVDWGRRSGIGWAIAATAAGCAVGVAALSIPVREVVFSREVTEYGCFQGPAGRGCMSMARLTVGNTGNVAQEVVEVHLPAAISRWQVSTRVLDIRASSERRPEPAIRHRPSGESIVYEVRPLPRNTLVEFRLQCAFCEPELAGALRASDFRVEAAARVREGDPRALTLLRTLRAALAALLPGS